MEKPFIGIQHIWIIIQGEHSVTSQEKRLTHLTEVAFEARFPILFFIPKRLGEFQELIIEEFDKSSEIKFQNISIQPNQEPEFAMDQAWEFAHKDGDPVIRLFKDKIVIFSKLYTSYEGSSGKSYKNCINYSLEKFNQIFKINKFTRIGLRYINTFDVEEESTDWLKSYFHPLYNLEKYPIQDTLEFKFALRIKREKANLVIQSGYIRKDGLKYILDFDAYKEECRTIDFPNALDDLHASIKSEFDSLITEEMKEKLGV